MADPNVRLANYIDGVNPERIKTQLVALKPAMLVAQQAAQNALLDIYTRAQGVLASEETVTVLKVAGYMFYCYEIFKLSNHHFGAQLINQVALILAKWHGRGYAEAVLIRLRNEVFSIPAPGAPIVYLTIGAPGSADLGAAITINGALSGLVTPLVSEPIPLPVGGTLELVLKKALYEDYTISFPVVADQVINCNAHMELLPI